MSLPAGTPSMLTKAVLLSRAELLLKLPEAWDLIDMIRMGSLLPLKEVGLVSLSTCNALSMMMTKTEAWQTRAFAPFFSTLPIIWFFNTTC